MRELERTLSTVRDECETHRGERVQLEKVAAMVPVLEEAENRHAPDDGTGARAVGGREAGAALLG